MNAHPLLHALTATLVLAAPVLTAAGVDMDDPRRAVGRENDVRVDAQIVQDTVSAGSPVGVVYQIQNLSTTQIAVADRIVNADYDPDSATITLGIGAEVPDDGKMPKMVLIEPGEKKVFRGGATPVLNNPAIRASLERAPRFVRVKVTILRNLAAFASLLRQNATPKLSDEQFEQWFEANDTIYLNAVPVRYSSRPAGGGMPGAESRGAGAGSY